MEKISGNTLKYFSYCPDTGIRFHETAEGAMKVVREDLLHFTDGPIHDDVNMIFWGEIREIATLVSEEPCELGKYDSIQGWEMKEL